MQGANPRTAGMAPTHAGGLCAVGDKESSEKDSGRDALEWAKDITTRGAGEILLTSMDKDGTQSGFDLDLLNIISSNVSIPVIASGGAGTLDHLEEAITKGKADAVLAASIFHYSKYSIVQAKQYLKMKGVFVRS